MPTYTYQCTECGHQFDLFHSMKDESTKSCPECGAEAKRRIGAGVGLIFKGSGFYITDYKNGHSSMPANGDNGNGHTAANGHASSNGTTAKDTPKAKESEKKADPAATTASTKVAD